MYNGDDRTMMIKPFTYEVLSDLENWCRKSDSYLLAALSTSPSAEPAHFCQAVRATLRRMMRNPRPLETLFPGARPRVYQLERRTGAWRLEGPDLADTTSLHSNNKPKTWGFREFKMAFL